MTPCSIPAIILSASPLLLADCSNMGLPGGKSKYMIQDQEQVLEHRLKMQREWWFRQVGPTVPEGAPGGL